MLKLTLEEVKEIMDAADGNLNLYNAPPMTLPDGLVVEGDCDLSFSRITKLPKNMTVKGYLDLDGTAITERPEGLVVEGIIYGGFSNL